MLCNNSHSLLNQSDFDCVGLVAKHCDLPKLCIAINESENFDLSNLFCDFWLEIVSIWQEVEDYQKELQEFESCEENCIEPTEPDNYELKVNLICGGSFESCGGKTRRHLGVKKIFAYYAYARYVLINSYNDSANGGVSKTNDFSIPIPQKDLEKISDRYRTMGYESFEATKSFICVNRDILNYDGKCGGCGCGCEDCKGGTKAKGYGFKGSIIKKKIR